MAHDHTGTEGPAVLTPPTGLTAVPAVPLQRTPSEPPEPITPLPPAGPALRLCACGHPEDVHEHYRPGTDCGACGASACAGFRPEGEREPRGRIGRWLRRR